MILPLEMRHKEMERLGVKIMCSDCSIIVDIKDVTPEKMDFWRENGYEFEDYGQDQIIGHLRRNEDKNITHENGWMKVKITE